MTLLPTIAKL